MLRPVIRGARWYRHVARSSSPAASPLPFRRTFTAVAPRSTNYGGPSDKIKFYEQDGLKSRRRQEVDPEAESNAEREDVEREIAQLDRELETLKDPFSPDGAFIQSLPEDKRAIALEALRHHEAEDGNGEPLTLDDVFDEKLDQALKEEFEGMAEEEENWMHNKDEKETNVILEPYQVNIEDSEHSAYIDRFNGALKRFAVDDSSEKSRQDLWKWYRGCKQIIPGFIDAIPQEGMALLWSSQLSDSSKANRAAHIQTLARDALSAGRSLSATNILSYIKSLQQLGRTQDALDQWEIHQVGLSQQKEDLEAYWKLGVELFAAEGDPQRAQDIALAFLTNDNSRQPSILIPVITAWVKQAGQDADVKAWALYLQLKSLLRNEMTVADYDQISIAFLKAGKLGLALAVFKDMMVTGQDLANDSASLYQAALGLIGNLQASSVSDKDVNRISLSTLTVLPRRYQNRFFYASWLKRLIGMGEIDSAALVIELMYERGVNPDPKHLNGLIAAWLRVGNTPSREKAEQLGWSMIKERIERASKAQAAAAAQPQTSSITTRVPKFMQRPMPPANIETFSILLLHYTRRGDEEATERLVESLIQARIQPNSYFMNHLLYAELRKQDIDALWTKFQTMSAAVQPDLETYACLWDCGKLQYDRSRTAFTNAFPTARALHASMITWFNNLSARAKLMTQEDFSKDLYDQIIRCFCLSKDLPGTLVALCSLRSTFGFAPDDTTLRLIILQVARLAAVPSNTPKRRLRRVSSTPRSKENIGHVQRLVEVLHDRKAGTLEARGLAIEELDPHERETHQLEIITDLLRVIMGRTEGGESLDADAMEEQIRAVAEEMGVSGIELGPKLDDNAGLVSPK
ncbi:pentatricopeptide repeat protein [Aspergillus stella-maris]|uniref:pentatricopeptide repeat protein n=1 Tax=Aspergillus stella-maris TaxID=1810926 RepID=UPI003CCCBE33